MKTQLKFELEAIVITFLEVKENGQPFFMKRIFKKEHKAREFLETLLNSDRNVSNVQYKINYYVSKKEESLSMTLQERYDAYEAGGERERYALSQGQEEIVSINGDRCVRFSYSETEEYQDANGATYNCVQKRWID